MRPLAAAQELSMTKIIPLDPVPAPLAEAIATQLT